MLTVTEAQADGTINRISGVCPGSTDWYDLINKATRQLMRRGNWWGTLKIIRGCIYNNCLTWPRVVGTVLALRDCAGSAPPKNSWYEFDAVLPEHVRCWNRFQTFPGCDNRLALVDTTTSPVFNQIPCLNDRFLQFYITQPTDVGKTITVFGTDGNGVEILTLRSDGTIQPGVVLTFALPFVQTPTLIRNVSRIIKDVTDGPVYGYQFDGTNRFAMATYAPGETLPDYRTSRITHGCSCCPTQITAFIKLEFIKVTRPNDLILIDNLDALAMGMQAAKLGDAYDSGGSETMMARAVHELNLDLRNKLPIDEIPVRFSPQGTAHLRRQRIGSMQ